jgi:hypothetical protein
MELPDGRYTKSKFVLKVLDCTFLYVLSLPAVRTASAVENVGLPRGQALAFHEVRTPYHIP